MNEDLWASAVHEQSQQRDAVARRARRGDAAILAGGISIATVAIVAAFWHPTPQAAATRVESPPPPRVAEPARAPDPAPPRVDARIARMPSCMPSDETVQVASKRQAFVDGWAKKAKAAPYRPLERECGTLILRVFIPPDCERYRIDEENPGLLGAAKAAGFTNVWCVGHNYKVGGDRASTIEL